MLPKNLTFVLLVFLSFMMYVIDFELENACQFVGSLRVHMNPESFPRSLNAFQRLAVFSGAFEGSRNCVALLEGLERLSRSSSITFFSVLPTRGFVTKYQEF